VPNVAVMKPLRVAIDCLDGDKFTRLMTTSCFHVCITVSRQNTVWWRTKSNIDSH